MSDEGLLTRHWKGAVPENTGGGRDRAGLCTPQRWKTANAGSRRRGAAGGTGDWVGGTETFTVPASITGRWQRGLAQPHALRSPPGALALLLTPSKGRKKQTKTKHKNKKWEGNEGRKEKNQQQKPSIKTPPAELSPGHSQTGRTAPGPWPATAPKPFRSDGKGGDLCTERGLGVTRGPPQGPRGRWTGWLSAAAGPAWTQKAGTAAGSVR